MEVFFRYPHQLFTRERLLSRVWGDDTEIEESNLNTYIHFVRKKLKSWYLPDDHDHSGCRIPIGEHP